MNDYADSSKGAASGKNNQPTNQPTNNHPPLTLLEAYKRLSRRECEVLEKIREDKSCKQIANELFISKKTVENHITNIGRKLKKKGRGRLREWIQAQKD
jgi:LuxR family transcriptional regulator of spore coat protein